MKIISRLSMIFLLLVGGNLCLQGQTQYNVLLQPGQQSWESWLLAADNFGPQKAPLPASLAANEGLSHLLSVQKMVRSTAPQGFQEEALRWYSVSFDSTMNLSAETWLLSQGVFEQVEPVRYYQLDQLDFTPNDDSLDRQWYHSYIQSEKAWDITRGSNQVRIGVIDTGIDYLHEEFDGQMWINASEDRNNNGRFDPWPATELRNGVSGDFDGIDQDNNGYRDDVVGYDFADQPSDPSFGDYLTPDSDPFDDNSHGTLVSGVIGAKMDNNYGGAGIAPDCKIVVLRAFTANGSGQDDDISRAIVYAADNGIPVLNFSFGDIYPSRMMQSAIQYAYVRGVIMIGSAGNGKGDVLHYPSGFSEVISVSGSTFDASDGREFFWPLSSYGLTVDLTAPAAGILTTQPLDTLDSGEIKAFTRTQGTSFSAPMVSAAVGLLLSQRGSLTPEQARGLLRSTTDDISSTGWDHFTGAGRLNLYKLLTAVGNSEVSILSPLNDSGTPADSVWITGTVLHPEFLAYHLEYQPGTEGDQDWFPILMDQPYQKVGDTLALWQTGDLAEGEYTLRLRLDKTDGFTVEDRIRFVIDRSAPEIEIFQAVSAWGDQRNGWFFRFRSSDQGRHTLHYRRAGETQFRSETADRFTRNEDFWLTQDDLLTGTYEWYIESENLAGLTGQTPLATFDWQSQNIQRLGVSFLGNPIPMGRYLETPTDADGDGMLEVVMSEYDASLSFGKLKWYEFNGSFFRAVDSVNFKPILIPKAVGDVDRDGDDEILVSVNDSMFVLTKAAGAAFPKDILWKEEDNGRYAAGLEDTDGDGELELVSRDTKDFFVYEWSGSFNEVATLPNTSPTNLAPGLARLWTADADGDKRPELLFGDADADIVAYEHQSGNTYSLALIDSTDFAEANAESFITTGDFDGDGNKEWFVAVRTSDLENEDGEYNSPFWRMRIFDQSGATPFAVVWEDYLFDNDTKAYTAATSANLDNDPEDEILFSTFPRTYLLEYVQGEYTFTWYQTGNIQTHHVVGDFNGNGIAEFTLGRGDSAFFFEKNIIGNGPQPVTSLSGRVMGADRVELTWLPGANATGYELIRLPDPDQNNLATLIGPIPATSFLDVGLTANVPHLYVLRSLNLADTSGFGNAIILTPHQRPRLDSVVALSATQLEVYFSQPVMDRETDKGRFKVNGTNVPLAVIANGNPGESLIITLAKPIDIGWHTLQVDTTFMDALRGVLDPNFAQASFYYEPIEEDNLFLTHWKIVDDKTARLFFNYPLDEVSALDSTHYTLTPVGSIVAVAWGSEDFDAIDITIEDARLGALGYPLSVTVEDVCAIHQVCIDETGNTATFSTHMEDLSAVFVYPNPVRDHKLFDGLRFANLTREAFIEVYTVSGRRVQRLEEKDGDGGLEWDMRDEGGYRIKPGIYLYRVYTDSGDVEEFVGKFSVVE
ncbi:MAG: S8 family serine peptidase [Bacteroidia bacterium]|nr:S8 family serine peptidase [Bacteroidia bacterium]